MKRIGKGKKIVVTGKSKYPRYIKEHKTRTSKIEELLEDTDKKILSNLNK